jgi:hypothetical protein
MKDYRDKEMKNLIYMLFFLFLIWCTPILEHINDTEDKSKYTILATALESAVISGILSSATLLCDCLVSSSLKDKLVGLFFLPRAGETVFSRINSHKLKDDRFQISDAVAAYTDIIQQLPADKKNRRRYENKNWYGIYQKHQEKGQVSQCQKDYLMCRDLYIEVVLFLVLYIISLFIAPSIVVFSKKFVISLIFLAIAFNFCTHLKMNRFVNTTIAVDIANRSVEKTSSAIN